MELSIVKKAIEDAKNGLNEISARTSFSGLAPDESIRLLYSASETMRQQAKSTLAAIGIAESPVGEAPAQDSNKSAAEQFDYAELQWLTLADYLYELLENKIEQRKALETWNARVPELEGAAKALVAANARAHREAHPEPTTGLGDIRIGEPAYVAVIVGKLDEILDRLESGQRTKLGADRPKGGVNVRNEVFRFET